MFLDVPGRFLYRHHVDTYSAMRIVCTRYRCLICLGVVLAVATVVILLRLPGTFDLLRITSATN